MNLENKYKLADMLKEIDDDIHDQKKGLSQEKNIPQETITELMIANLKQKQKKAT
jgi:hypothetical protein